MTYSNHALKRIRQRSIPETVVNLILAYGEEFPAGGGARIIKIVTRLAKKNFILAVESAGLQRKENWTNAYLIIGKDNAIITAGYRSKRVKRDYC